MISALLSYTLQEFYRLGTRTAAKKAAFSCWVKEEKNAFHVHRGNKGFQKEKCFTPYLRESRSLLFSRSFPTMTWVITAQACCPDCCVTFWGWSRSARDEKCSCYGRIWFVFFFLSWCDMLSFQDIEQLLLILQIQLLMLMGIWVVFLFDTTNIKRLLYWGLSEKQSLDESQRLTVLWPLSTYIYLVF